MLIIICNGFKEDEVTLDDPALGYTGQGAYGFENIYQLAQDPRTQHKALTNSGKSKAI